MANTIQVKRGLEANRTSVTPLAGELLYTTDTKKVFVGDGVTAGGVAIGDVRVGSSEFVASGTVPNGTVVVLNSNGTVSTPTVINQTDSAGATTTLTSANSAYLQGMVYDSVNNKVIVAYGTDSATGVIAVGTISGSTISFATPVTFFTGDTVEDVAAAFNPATQTICLMFRRTLSPYELVIAGTISGNTATFGTAVNHYAGSVDGKSALHLGDNKFLFAYYYAGILRNRIFSVSGTTVTSGTRADVATALSSLSGTSLVKLPDADKYACVYTDGVSVRYLTASFSGTTITAGSATTISTEGTNPVSIDIVAKTGSNVIVAAWRGTSSYPRTVAGTVSGSTITWGTVQDVNAATIYSGGVYGCIRVTYDNLQDKFVYYVTPTSSTISTIRATLSGTTFSFGSLTSVKTGTAIGSPGLIAQPINLPGTGKQVIYWSTGTDAFTAIWTNTVFSTNAGNFIGISAEAISSGATGTVTVLGGISVNQTGLTAGNDYWVASDGTLTTTPTAYGHLGTALSTTELLIADNRSRVTVSALNTTGTASSSTFLRGDGAWATAGAMVFLTSATVTGTPSAIDITGLPQYGTYIIDVTDLSASTTTTLFMQMYTNGTLITGAEYAFGGITHNSASTTVLYSSNSTEIRFATSNIFAGSTANSSVRIVIYGGAQSSRPISVKAHGDIQNSNSLTSVSSGVCRNTALQTLTGFRLLTSSGTFASGAVKVYGVL